MAFWEKWIKRGQDDTVDTILCPFCGATIAASESDCPACGRVIRISYVQGEANEVNDDVGTASEPAFGDSFHRQSAVYNSTATENHFGYDIDFDKGETAFCHNCGAKLNENAKFCHVCGTSCNYEQNNDINHRKTVYDGVIHKCPNCGEVLQSMTAICPSCGYEINSAKLSPALKEFIDKINACDEAIANTPKQEIPKRSWKSWKKSTKILWVLLNLLTSGIPLVAYLVYPLIRPLLRSSSVPQLSKWEERKVSLIENFAFPNDRESVLEALLFTKAKVAFLASEKSTEMNIYWTRLWYTKAVQLNQKANILLKNDPIAESAFDEISTNKKRVDQKVRVHAIIGTLIIAVFCAFVAFGRFGLFGGNSSNSTLSATTSIVTTKISPVITEDSVTNEDEGIYTYSIRNYVGKNLASVGEMSGDYLVDEYGHGELKISIITEDGMLILPDDDEAKKNYTIVAQNIEEGTNITIVHLRDSENQPYNNLVNYQSYDEIILYVTPIGTSDYTPSYEQIFPTLDRHTYHIRDYVGRNAASFGEYSGNSRIDEYGKADLEIVFASEDGTYIDVEDINNLKNYIVISQDIEANSELTITYMTDSKGVEYDNLVQSQNYEQITLTVRRLDDSITSQMTEIMTETGTTTDSSSSSSSEDVDLTLKYKVLNGDEAKITGYSGNGSHATISKKIDGYTVVSIGEKAFKDCTTLESLTIWADIETIDDYAFAGCTGLTEISIPNDTEEIGAHAFEGCTKLTSLIIWGDPEIGDYAFAGCTGLTEISIPNDTEEIGAHAFEGCTGVTSLIIWGDSNIGDYAFAGCTGITEVSISMHTERVGSHAFDGCTNLKTVTIWDDDTIIEKDAFANCPNLTGMAEQE